MSKGYTINFFVNAFTGVTNKQIVTTGVYGAVSPRYGFNSVKAKALDNFLGGLGRAKAIAEGSGSYANLGKTPRTRLLRALRNRKNSGTVL